MLVFDLNQSNAFPFNFLIYQRYQTSEDSNLFPIYINKLADEIEEQLNLYKEQSKKSKQKIKNRDIERIKLSIKESVLLSKSVDKIIEIAATKKVAAKNKDKDSSKKVVAKKKPKNVKSTKS